MSQAEDGGDCQSPAFSGPGHQEFTIREVLLFIHDALRFMRIVGPLNTSPGQRNTSASSACLPDLALCTAGFRAQPIVRLIDNIIKQFYLSAARPSTAQPLPSSVSFDAGDKFGEGGKLPVLHDDQRQQFGDVISLLQQSLNRKLEWMVEQQGLFDSLLTWIHAIVTENRGSMQGTSTSHCKLMVSPLRLCWAEVRTTSPANGIRHGSGSATISGNAGTADHQVGDAGHDPPSEDRQRSEEEAVAGVDSAHHSKGVCTEVVIHVVDDVRGGHKDFTLPANILLEKMPYFAKATRGQVLSDVDITVHCDVNIFEWLTKWMNSTSPPVLDPTNVVPVLLSAAFLETEKLVEECLHYCHAHTTQILDAKQSFSCLNDQLIEKLASKFTAAEVEQLGHQRSSLQSRLYACLIVDLCSSSPSAISPKRGIFRTAASLFFCSQCGQLLTEEVQLKAPCATGRIVLTATGRVVYRHQRDECWNLTEYIQGLKSTLKSWRRVYWRLWSLVHFLDCSSCGLPFAAADFLKCSFHPEAATFPNVVRNKTNYQQPIGKHPCCQMPAYRFSTAPNNQGCRMREHAVSCVNLEQIQVMSMCHQFADLIQLNVSYKPYTFIDPTKMARSYDPPEEIVPRFTLGLPSRPRRHLVPLPWQPEHGATKDPSRPKTAASSSQDSGSTSGSAESDETKFRGGKGGGSGCGDILDPNQAMCYDEDEEDIQEDEDEVEQDLLMLAHSQAGGGKCQPLSSGGTGRDGLLVMRRFNGISPSSSHQMLVLRRKFSTRRENKLKPQPLARELDLRWNPCLSSRSNQDSQRYLEEELLRRITQVLAPPQWQKARSPVGGLFAKINRVLQEKAQRELKQMAAAKAASNASSTSRSISAASIAALAARKFKAQLHTNHPHHTTH